MAKKYKKFSPKGKVRLLRLHLIEKEPISDICDRHGINHLHENICEEIIFAQYEV